MAGKDGETTREGGTEGDRQGLCPSCGERADCTLSQRPTYNTSCKDHAKIQGALKTTASGGVKEVGGKIDWSVLPLDKVKEVIDYGAKKYSPENWRKVDKEEYAKSAFRHIFALLYGEEVDSESGFYHASHAISGLLFWLGIKEEQDDKEHEETPQEQHNTLRTGVSTVWDNRNSTVIYRGSEDLTTGI